MIAAVGQVWASTRGNDVRDGVRQHRTITEVAAYESPTVEASGHAGYAYLETKGSRNKGAWGIALDRRGALPRHRLVSDPRYPLLPALLRRGSAECSDYTISAAEMARYAELLGIDPERLRVDHAEDSLWLEVYAA